MALLVVLVGSPALLSDGVTWLVIVGILVVGAGTGALFPLASTLHVQASPRGADGALGQTLTVAALAQVVGPLGAGALAQVADLRVGLLLVPAFALLAGLSLLRELGPPQGSEQAGHGLVVRRHGRVGQPVPGRRVLGEGQHLGRPDAGLLALLDARGRSPEASALTSASSASRVRPRSRSST